MITTLKNLTIEQAKGIIFQNFDESTNEARVLRKQWPKILEMFETIIRQLEECENRKDVSYLSFPPKEFANMMHEISVQLPSILLIESGYSWDNLCSAIYFIFNSYSIAQVVLAQTVLQDTTQPKDILEQAKTNVQLFNEIQHNWLAVLQLIDIGASYLNLINASNYIIQQFRQWSVGNPSAVRLSEMYLKSLGYCKGKED